MTSTRIQHRKAKKEIKGDVSGALKASNTTIDVELGNGDQWRASHQSSGSIIIVIVELAVVVIQA